MKKLKSLEKAIAYFHQEGFKTEFRISFDTIIDLESKRQFDTFDFEVQSSHEVEDEDDILNYFLVSTSNGTKGYLLNDYSPASDPVSIEMIDKLQLQNISRLD